MLSLNVENASPPDVRRDIADWRLPIADLVWSQIRENRSMFEKALPPDVRRWLCLAVSLESCIGLRPWFGLRPYLPPVDQVFVDQGSRERFNVEKAWPPDVRRRLRPAVSLESCIGLRPWFGLRPYLLRQ